MRWLPIGHCKTRPAYRVVCLRPHTCDLAARTQPFTRGQIDRADQNLSGQAEAIGRRASTRHDRFAPQRRQGGERLADKGRQRAMPDLLQDMNELDAGEFDSEMQARIAAYELAFRMQSHAPEAVDLTKESSATKRMYGLDQDRSREFGTRLLLARRLVERGVRFVQVYSGGGPISMQWDAHKHLKANHEKMAGHSDQPVAALLEDLKQRGLLDKTLVIWGAEFGRLPTSESGSGRDHNPHGYTMWFAGGGVRGGQAIGSTDEFGLRAVDQPYNTRDFHATILHALGLDQERLSYLHNGRYEKLTDFGGNVIESMFA